jgi:glycosyltransferase involved in cell wall biosynthesis
MAVPKLHIAMVVPPWFDIPPREYGGIEVMCAALVDALVDRGHQVTIVGNGSHRTRGQFRRVGDHPPAHHLGQVLPELAHAARTAAIVAGLRPDIVHDHSVAGPLQAASRPVPTVVTVHGPVAGYMGEYYRALGTQAHLVAISESQCSEAPDLNWCSVVHNSVEVRDFPFRSRKEEFVLFLGRFNPDKGAHVALDAARAAGLPIVLAGKCTEDAERRYFEERVRPRLGPDTTFLGQVSRDRMGDLMARARCLLFPICWEEPFGMVMIEANACGTPVVALRRGAVPEVVVDGVTGVICDSPDELPEAIRAAGSMDPARCRASVADRFRPSLSAEGYERVYRQVLAPRPQASGSRGPRTAAVPALLPSARAAAE